MKFRPSLSLAAMAACGLAACHGSIERGRAMPAEQSPGVKSTANLPPSPNHAATGSSTANSSLAIVGGQIPDASNPTPSGIPAASPALH
jgi:hypothetical protein